MIKEVNGVQISKDNRDIKRRRNVVRICKEVGASFTLWSGAPDLYTQADSQVDGAQRWLVA